MTFPISEYSRILIDQVVDVRLQQARYNRPRALGNKKPYWMLSITNPPEDYATAMNTSSILDSYMGPLNTFALPNPLPEVVTRTGLQVSTAASKDDTAIDIKNLPTSTANACAGGDFINFTGHAKAYRIVGNHASDGSGIATVTITPPLFQDVALDTAISYGDDVQFQCCLVERAQMEVKANNGKFIVHDFDVMEQG